MEKLIVLGTGCASARRCYHTCFALDDGQSPILVDAGGGNQILNQLDQANLSLTRIHHAFLTHSHSDHMLGMIWILRAVATMMRQGQFKGEFSLYCHAPAAELLMRIVQAALPPSTLRFFDGQLRILPVTDGETRRLGAYDVTFFDILSSKALQYGFSLTLHNGAHMLFTGDEPLNKKCTACTKPVDWLLTEAFCLESEKHLFKPHEKHHSTVRDACLLAETHGVHNLVLWHTEDTHLHERKILYTKEGSRFFSGRLYVPDDLDTIMLDFPDGESKYQY